MNTGTIIHLLCFFLHVVAAAGANREKILLKEVETITLQHDQKTTGYRSPPVPQLKCVGGTAGCNAFQPKVVQCYNRGWDGHSVQWECKTDMEQTYTFGKLEVSCEGFSYPGDPYILRGSCGLEYTIDITKPNSDAKQVGDSYGWKSKVYEKTTNYNRPWLQMNDILILMTVGVVMYGIYKVTLSRPVHSREFRAPTAIPPEYRESTPDYGWSTPSGGSFQDYYSPPGFKPSYYPGADYGSSRRPYTHSSTGSGFWSGLATGGLLGYMFGNQTRNTGHQHSDTSFTNSSHSDLGTRRAPEVRTASGFGGTSRR